MNSHVVEHYLPSGLRVVCEVMPRVRSAAIGFLVRTGSRHEARHEHGVSHFLEHMCFKGTPTRDWRAINVRFDELGSIYNAFTSKEHTVYYGWVPSGRIDEQLELLADMIRPSLPAQDFETERNVILEEIAMAGDGFDHHVWNFLHESIFPNHALSHEILGEKETIETIARQTMVDYHARRYSPENVILVAAGAVDPNEVFAAAGRYCERWGRATANGHECKPPAAPASGVRKQQLEQFKQQLVAVVFPSVSQDSPFSEDIEAFTSLFGGANSRCYWNIVQKGVCSQAGAAWLSYADCGVMALYADGDPSQAEAMLAALREQAEEVSRHGFREDEVQRVKNRRRTQLALEAENPRTRLMQLFDDLEVRGQVQSTDARLAAVEAVRPETIAAYFKAHPISGEGMLISCGPRDWPL